MMIALDRPVVNDGEIFLSDFSVNNDMIVHSDENEQTFSA